MVGDVNIFLKGTPGDQEFEAEAEIMIAGELAARNISAPSSPPPRSVASELMMTVQFPFCSEPDYRRKGIASIALQLMFSYATAPDSKPPLPIGKESLVVRVGDRNTASISLFQKLGFEITKHVAVFEETELRYTGKDVSSEWLIGERRPYDL